MHKNYHFLPLILVQLLVVVLFFVFGTYTTGGGGSGGGTPGGGGGGGGGAPNPAPVGRTDGGGGYDGSSARKAMPIAGGDSIKLPSTEYLHSFKYEMETDSQSTEGDVINTKKSEPPVFNIVKPIGEVKDGDNSTTSEELISTTDETTSKSDEKSLDIEFNMTKEREVIQEGPNNQQDNQTSDQKNISLAQVVKRDINTNHSDIEEDKQQIHEKDRPILRVAPATGDVSFGSDTMMNIHAMIFVGFGFLMTFLKKYSYSAVGFNMLLAAMSVQLALVCHNMSKSYFSKGSFTINLSIASLVEADITAATVLITFGAVIGLTTLHQMTFIAIVETIVAVANLYLYEKIFMCEDPGGSVPIHAFGAYFGLGVSLGLKLKNLDKPAATGIGSTLGLRLSSTTLPKLNEASYESDVFAMIGTLFLFIFWPSFNSAAARSQTAYDRAIMNTFLSIAASVVSSFIMSSMMKEGKLDMVHVQNSVLSGGVAIGSIATINTYPGASVLIGSVTGMVSVAGYKILTPKIEEWGIMDTCGVNNLHGMPGIISGLLSILFCFLSGTLPSDEKKLVYSAGRTDNNQAMFQFYGLISTLGIAFFTGLIVGYITKKASRRLNQSEVYKDDKHWHVPE